MSAVDDVNELARLIRDVEFTPVRLHEGYRTGDVDDFLDLLVEDVLADRDVRATVALAQFGRSRLREGYEMTEVDSFLRLVVDIADGRADVPPPPPPERPGLFARLRNRA
jgi:DivIVA domain-containing protein